MKAFFSPKLKKRSSRSAKSGKSSPREEALSPRLSLCRTLPNTVFDGEKFIGGSFARCLEYALLVNDVRAILYSSDKLDAGRSPNRLLTLLGDILDNSTHLQMWMTQSAALSPEQVKKHISKMLLDWVAIGFFFDFQADPKLVKRLHKMLESLLPPMEHNRIKLLLLKGKLEPHGLVFPDSRDALKVSDPVDSLVTGTRFFLQQDPSSIAQELSSIDFELYRSIEASELMDKNWQRSNAETLSPNLVALRKRFNQLSFWAITMVLRAADTRTQQIKLVRHLLEISWHLYTMRSYNSMGALVAGLASISLTRLPYLWENLSKNELKRREELDSVFEVTSNFRFYRSLLTQEHACIPYLPLHLRDMLAIYEREENYLDSKDSDDVPHINYDKISALGGAMHTILQFRGAQVWKGTHNSVMRDFLLGLPFSEEDDLLEASDRWKASAEGDLMQSTNLVGEIRCGMHENVVAIEVSFDSWKVMMPFPIALTYKDLIRRVRGITGRESDMFYQTQQGLQLQLASQKEMPAFLASSDNLHIEAIYSRGTIRARLNRNSINTSNRTSRSGSFNMFSPPSPAELAAAATQPELGRKRSASSVGEDSFSLIPGLSMSPLMSPRGDEKRRLLLLELVCVGANEENEKAQEPREYVVPAHVAWNELVAMMVVLLGHGDALEFFVLEHARELGDPSVGTPVDDESKWIKALKLSSKDQKLYLNVRRSE